MNNNVNSELLAVITAAVAAQYSRSGLKLEVKTIRRISQTSPVWNATGRYERLAGNMNRL